MSRRGGHPTDRWGSSYAYFAALGLALVGFGITFGLFRWEIRNITKCDWFILRAADVEAIVISGGDEKQLSRIQYLRWGEEEMERASPDWGKPWGKTEAEFFIYRVAMLAWLIPAAFALASLLAGLGT